MNKWLKRIVLILTLATYVGGSVAQADTISDQYGRSAFNGYFYNNFQDCSSGCGNNKVFPLGVPLSVGTVEQLIGFIRGRLNSGSTQDVVGAEFLVDTMLGYTGSQVQNNPGVDNVVNDSIVTNQTRYNAWVQRIRGLWQIFGSKFVKFNQNYLLACGSVNSYYQPTYHDDALYYLSDTSECGHVHTSIVFADILHDPGHQYVIKYDCGNPISTAGYAGLLTPATLSGSVRDNSGKGISGVTVQAVGDSNTISDTTDGSGNYSITWPMGSPTNNGVSFTMQVSSGSVTSEKNQGYSGPTTPSSKTGNGYSPPSSSPSYQHQLAGYNCYGTCNAPWGNWDLSNDNSYDFIFTKTGGNNPPGSVTAQINVNGPSSANFTAGPRSVGACGTNFTVNGSLFCSSASGQGIGNGGATTIVAPANFTDGGGTAWKFTSWTSSGNNKTSQLNCSSTSASGCVLNIPASSKNGTFVILNANYAAVPSPPEHKVYAANIVTNNQDVVRDNEAISFGLKTYIWPDAGLRSNGNNFWLAGIWGNDSGDNVFADNSRHANPNTITSLNNVAEKNCNPPSSGACLQRVPLAYVPQNDGSGQPGSTTPNGNNWLSIEQGTLGGDPDMEIGGIASSWGATINNVEISNIHIRANGIQSSANDVNGSYGLQYQGLVDSKFLQPSPPDPTIQYSNLPAFSQGPQGTGWDNIRDPNQAGSGYSYNLNNGNLEFQSPQSVGNADPNNIGSGFAQATQLYATVGATSFLQDGQGNYVSKSEPLTFSATVTHVNDAQLVWDEYDDWNQVDDKGHYYTTQSFLQTGAYSGSGQYDWTTLWGNGWNPGSQFTGYYATAAYAGQGNDPPGVHCSTFKRGNCTKWVCPSESQRHSGAGDACFYKDYLQQCEYVPTTNTVYTESHTYYPASVQTKAGWYNTSAGGVGLLNGQGSNFYPYYISSTPWWANVANYWQDPNITSMSQAGSTNKPSYNNPGHWIYNTTDPVYANRYIYDAGNPQTVTWAAGWYPDNYEYSCWWPNGFGPGAYGTAVGPYYPNQGDLYEWSGYPGGDIVLGDWQSHDGSANGYVDTGWAYAHNYQYVRYNQTFTGHYRDLGARDIGGSPSSDNFLYGLEGSSPPQQSAKAARGVENIGNPTIAVSGADIFGAKGVSSYFTNSNNADFIFTNGQINAISNLAGNNFSTAGVIPNYFYNNDQTRVNSTYPSSGNQSANQSDPVRYVFTSFDSALVGKSVAYPGGNNVNLSGKIYNAPISGGSYTMTATQFCNGAGTIIVQGDLNITGNLTYCPGNPSRANLPSVGFIVTGNINVSPNVTSIVGAYFVGKTFSTGTVVTSGNRTTSDQAFALNGLIVAQQFNLQRQTPGATNLSSSSETFAYDPRVVISPPPGFSDVFTAQAVWNEAAPEN